MDQIIGSDYLKLVKQYERYEYLNKTLQISSGFKKYLVQRIFFTNCERFRIQIRRQSSVCENIYEHADVWQDHQGPDFQAGGQDQHHRVTE